MPGDRGTGHDGDTPTGLLLAASHWWRLAELVRGLLTGYMG